MSEQRWRFLLNALDQLKKAELPVGLDVTLADRLEAAISAENRDRLVEARQTLAEFAQKAHLVAPAEVVEALRLPKANGNFVSAYSLGQIEFAQQFAARALERRAPDDLVQSIMSSRYRPYIAALYGEDLSGAELADRLDRRPETVSRNLSELREMGVVDCRRVGTSLKNFLTPHVRAAYAQTGEAERQSSQERRQLEVIARIEEQRMALEPHLREAVTF